MVNEKTTCEFRQICGSSRDTDLRIATLKLPAVPLPGEVINISGNPYVVHERGWAVGETTSGAVWSMYTDGEPPLYCYLRVTRLQSTPY